MKITNKTGDNLEANYKVSWKLPEIISLLDKKIFHAIIDNLELIIEVRKK